MKTLNKLIRIFAVLTASAGLFLYFILQKNEGEYIGNTGTVVLSSALIFFVTYLPSILNKRNIKIKSTLYLIILLSIVFTIGGGFAFRFYEIFNYYDTVIHFINGGVLVIAVFVILHYMSKDAKRYLLPIIFVAVISAISLGTLWEIYEFLVDSIFSNSNMQRFKDVKTGIEFIGQRALKDTMIDLIVDTAGAILGGIILYLDSIKGESFINKITLDKITVAPLGDN